AMRPIFPVAQSALALLLPLLAACADTTAPLPQSRAVPAAAPTTVPPAAAPYAPAPAFPALTKPGTIYVETGLVYGSSAYHGGELASRVVLYDDGRLGIQFSSPRWGFFEYGGNYARTDSTLSLTFEGWSVMGPWLATGTLSGDSLAIRYNQVMQLTDFV